MIFSAEWDLAANNQTANTYLAGAKPNPECTTRHLCRPQRDIPLVNAVGGASVMGTMPFVASFVWLVFVSVTMLEVGVHVELETVAMNVDVRPARSPAIVTFTWPREQ